MAADALDAWRRWYRDPERGAGCWCPSYPPCEGKALGADTCPNMPADVREEGERLWRQAEPGSGADGAPDNPGRREP